MNTKPIPAILALIAGFVTCIMSFLQHVDITVFAKRFIVVCIIFFIIGLFARIIIEVNFKDILYPEPEEEPEEGNEEVENIDSQEMNEEGTENSQGDYGEELENVEESEDEEE